MSHASPADITRKAHDVWKRAAVERSLSGRRVTIEFREHIFPDETHPTPVSPGHIVVVWAHLAGRAVALQAVLQLPGETESFVWRFHGDPTHPAIAAAKFGTDLRFSHVAIDRSGLPPFACREDRLEWVRAARDLAERGVLATTSTESTVRAQVEAAASTTTAPVEPATPRILFLSINPNAKDPVGHFIGFDRWLVDEVVSPTVTAVSLGHADLDEAHAAPFLAPWFDIATSPTNSAPRSQTARRFVAAATPRLQELLKQAARDFDHIHLFWYLGCAEFVPLLEQLTSEHARLSIHMHLFWDFQLREDDPVALRRFTELAGRGAALKNTHLSIGSHSQIERLFHSTGIEFAYFPAGPSTNISDDRGRRWLADQRAISESSTATRSEPTVLFPSNHAVGQKWELSARAALALQSGPDRAFTTTQLRFLPDQYGGEPDLPDSLRHCSGISLIEGELTASEITGLIAAAHVVAIPYGPEWFKNRTSALLTEAIIAGCRLVVLADTNLAEVVRATQSGTVVRADCTAEEFASAIANEQWRPLSESDYQLRLDWYAGTEWSVVAAEAIRPLVRSHTPADVVGVQ